MVSNKQPLTQDRIGTPQENLHHALGHLDMHIINRSCWAMVLVPLWDCAGSTFTDYVRNVPPEVCGPKHAIRLRSAWNNVLAEAAAIE
eukprot:1443375-Amphidinium_carterae.1